MLIIYLEEIFTSIFPQPQGLPHFDSQFNSVSFTLQMKPTLEKAVYEACELQDEAPLLDQVLYPNFKLLHNNLHSLNFQRFLWHVWEVMVELFRVTVAKNTEVR